MNAISFLPLSYNVKWDGESHANAAIELPCSDTAATYSVSAFPIYTASGRITVSNGGDTTDTYTFSFARGDRVYATVLWNGVSPSSVLAPAVSLPVTVSSNVATIVFSGITATAFRAHAWNLKAVKSTTTRVLLRGRVEIDTNPYGRDSSTVYAASGVTAYGCF